MLCYLYKETITNIHKLMEHIWEKEKSPQEIEFSISMSNRQKIKPT